MVIPSLRGWEGRGVLEEYDFLDLRHRQLALCFALWVPAVEDVGMGVQLKGDVEKNGGIRLFNNKRRATIMVTFSCICIQEI